MAQKQYDEERRKKREKEEYQREKMRENIRKKYGIQKKNEQPSIQVREKCHIKPNVIGEHLAYCHYRSCRFYANKIG